MIKNRPISLLNNYNINNRSTNQYGGNSIFLENILKFLKDYWYHHVTFEEFPVVGTRLSLDFYNANKKKFDLNTKYSFEDVLQISNEAKIEKEDVKNDNEIKPIFIIGVPRCGSTLVEMIIGAGTKNIPRGEETTVFEKE